MLIISLSFFSISVLLLIFLIAPKIQDFQKISFEIEQKKKEISFQKDAVFEIDFLSRKLKEYPLELSKIDSAIPSEPGTLSLYDFFQQKIDKHNLLLKNVSSFSTSVVEEKKIKKTKFSLQVSGSFSDFKNFLSDIEKNSRLIEIENVSFVVYPLKQTADFYQLTIKAYSY